jgi:hypothetical protein
MIYSIYKKMATALSRSPLCKVIDTDSTQNLSINAVVVAVIATN